MSEFNFRLLLDVSHDLTDDELNALYEATESEATFGSDDDGWSAEFDREAADLVTAVIEAINQLESVPAGVHVRKLVSDDEVLVGASEIARRAGLSRQAVNFYADGDRKTDLGPFPAPITKFASGQRIWRWGEVAPWIARVSKRADLSSENTEAAAAINDFLDLRRRLPRVSAGARKLVTAALAKELALSA